MSLILEALKKAERQHKLGEVPRITPNSEQPAVTASHRIGWLMITLLALILVGLGIYLGSSWLSPQLPEPAVSRAAPVQLAREGETATAGVVPPPQAAAAPPPPQAAAAPPPTPRPSGIDEAQPVSPPPQPEEVVIAPPVEAEPAPPPRPPKPLHEMPSGFVANLPSLNIDIHSYDKRPAKRYVLINMEKYREGDYLAEGPRVLEILPEGAVMEHMGERFILPIGN